MLRITLFAVAALMSGVVNAQVASDRDAAAPVVYRDAGATAPGCDTDIRNADGSPVISCVANTPAQEEVADAETGEYAQGYAYDEVPDYDTSGYYAPNFYLGVSALPYDYWAFGLGWPYYGYASFGFGWPYFAFACCGHGGHHDGHDHHGHDGGFHGPYRYVGHGRYWDQTHASGFNHGGQRASSAAFASASAMNRSNAMGNRATLSSSRFAPAANDMVSGRATQQRAVLPSASYYAAAQSGGRANAISATRSMPASRNGAVNPNAANPNWVTSLPSRNYAAYARANSVYRNSSGGATRSGGYAPRSGYSGAPRSAYSMQQRYAMPSRGYSALRGAPSYSRGGGSATHSSAASSAHSSEGGHSSNGTTRGH